MIQEASPSLLSPLFEKKPHKHRCFVVDKWLVSGRGNQRYSCGGVVKPTDQTRTFQNLGLEQIRNRQRPVGAAGATELRERGGPRERGCWYSTPACQMCFNLFRSSLHVHRVSFELVGHWLDVVIALFNPRCVSDNTIRLSYVWSRFETATVTTYTTLSAAELPTCAKNDARFSRSSRHAWTAIWWKCIQVSYISLRHVLGRWSTRFGYSWSV